MALEDHEFMQRLPKKIIVVRHGESEGNTDESAYTRVPDHQIELTAQGFADAVKCGKRIREAIQNSATSKDWKVYFYVSPYKRTLSTLRGIGRAFEKERILGVREEVRIREQDFGNFQQEERMKVIKEIRHQFGRFFYRFPEGESAADVFDRVSSFLESLWRDIDMNRIKCRDGKACEDLTLVMVTHGLTGRVFLMKWFKWTVQQFERLNNPANCEYRMLRLGKGGEYSLAVHHRPEELLEWGLSEDMIKEQQWRAECARGQSNCTTGGDCSSEVFDKFYEEESIEKEEEDN